MSGAAWEEDTAQPHIEASMPHLHPDFESDTESSDGEEEGGGGEETEESESSDADGTASAGLRDFLRDLRPYIRNQIMQLGDTRFHIFQTPHGDCTTDEILRFLMRVARAEQFPFYVSLEPSYVLEHYDEERHVIRRRFFHNGSNVQLIRRTLIRSFDDCKRIFHLLKEINFMQKMYNYRPNSKWFFSFLTSIVFRVDRRGARRY